MEQFYFDCNRDMTDLLNERSCHRKRFRWQESPSSYEQRMRWNMRKECSYRYLMIPSKPSWCDKNSVIPTTFSGLWSGEGSRMRRDLCDISSNRRQWQLETAATSRAEWFSAWARFIAQSIDIERIGLVPDTNISHLINVRLGVEFQSDACPRLTRSHSFSCWFIGAFCCRSILYIHLEIYHWRFVLSSHFV